MLPLDSLSGSASVWGDPPYVAKSGCDMMPSRYQTSSLGTVERPGLHGFHFTTQDRVLCQSMHLHLFL